MGSPNDYEVPNEQLTTKEGLFKWEIIEGKVNDYPFGI
jgi:hypothetical protein